jgi:hypothetical protein
MRTQGLDFKLPALCNAKVDAHSAAVYCTMGIEQIILKLLSACPWALDRNVGSFSGVFRL